MIAVEGKCGIKATVLAHSISEAGNEIITYELEYPRIILAELNTHRMLSKNSFSSRAVPFDKMVKQLNGRPVRFGANQAGMQDKGEHNQLIGTYCGNNYYAHTAAEVWEIAKQDAIRWADMFKDAGYHKQIYNRLLEPWQMMKTVLSGTELDNFFWLRNHEAADPTFAELARVMYEAKQQSKPELLKAGEWHTPYVDKDETGSCVIYDLEGNPIYISKEEAIKVSCARCAAVSYRNEGYDLSKSIEVYDRLVGSDRKHASAFEHCATPIQAGISQHCGRGAKLLNDSMFAQSWEKGITHVDRDGALWSGNFKGWIQYRKLIPGENYTQ